MRSITKRDLLITGFVVALLGSAITEGCVYARLKNIDEANAQIQLEQAAQQRELDPAAKIEHGLDLGSMLLAQLQAASEQSKALCRVRVLVQVQGLKQFDPGKIEQCTDAIDEVLVNVVKSYICNEEGHLSAAATLANANMSPQERDALKKTMATCLKANKVDEGLPAVLSAYEQVGKIVERLRAHANEIAKRIEALRAEVKRLTGRVGQLHYLAFGLQIIGLMFALMRELRAKEQ